MTSKSSRSGAGTGNDQDRGVYSISVTAEMVGTGMQNLRLYERRGLVEPSRTAGGTRLYSVNDVRRLTRITELLADGLNLIGVAMVLDLQDDNTRLRQQAGRRSKATGAEGLQ
ncbi:MAG TPA: MerR family transcriptional regulator [Propionibacteriaceae bacterium]|nr:MerR family transcriptional regulator [Propionibacteriaceae bacterium]